MTVSLVPDEAVEAATRAYGPMEAALAAAAPILTRSAVADALERMADEIATDPGSHWVAVTDYCTRFMSEYIEPGECGSDEKPCPGHDHGDGHYVMHGRDHYERLLRAEAEKVRRGGAP